MQKIKCKDCGYEMFNLTDTVFKVCPRCDSSNIKVI